MERRRPNSATLNGERHERAMKEGIALPEYVVPSLEKAAQLVDVALPGFAR
jgi:hypothetical protein